MEIFGNNSVKKRYSNVVNDSVAPTETSDATTDKPATTNTTVTEVTMLDKVKTFAKENKTWLVIAGLTVLSFYALKSSKKK